MPAALFTFGSGAFGELGHARSEGFKSAEAGRVLFPPSAPRDSSGEPAVEAVALGTDHSLAVVGGRVYRWGLVGAHAVPRSWHKGGAGRWADTPKTSPEVVPAPKLLVEFSPPTGRARSRSPEEKNAGSQATPAAHSSRGVGAIACGGSNSFVLTTDGEAMLFGGLWPPGGDTDQLRHLWGIALGGAPSRVAQVAAGWRHCLLLTEAGHIFALGDNEHGQCAGTGSGVAAITLPSSHTAVGVAAGACHSVAWDRTGSAFSWGHGGSGRLGLGDAQHRGSPHRVEALHEAVCMASCGANFTLFLSERGRLWACGGNNYGQLGVDDGSSMRLVPVLIELPHREDEVVVTVQCGANHALCLTRATTAVNAGNRSSSVSFSQDLQRATAWAWGCSSSGQCGRAPGDDPHAAPPSMRPRPARLVEFLPPSPHWPVAVAAARSHSAVLALSGERVASGGVSISSAVPGVRKPSKAAVGGSAAGSRASSRANSRGSSGSPPKQAFVTAASKGMPLKVRGEEDIIEEFLRQRDDKVLESPGRSQSPAKVLVELGEAMLLLETDDLEGSGGELERPDPQVSSLLPSKQAAARRLQAGVLHAGGPRRLGRATRNISPRTRAARNFTPRLAASGKNAASRQGRWPRPPSSWAEEDADEQAEVTCRNCSGTGRDFLGKPCSCPLGKAEAARQARPASLAQKASPAKPANAGVAGILAEAIAASQIEKKAPDPYAGVFESLKGVSAMIANIGSPERGHSPTPRQREAAQAALGGGSGVHQGVHALGSVAAADGHRMPSAAAPGGASLLEESWFVTSGPQQVSPALVRKVARRHRDESLSDGPLDFSPRSFGEQPGHGEQQEKEEAALSDGQPFELTADVENDEEPKKRTRDAVFQGQAHEKALAGKERWWREQQEQQEEKRRHEQLMFEEKNHEEQQREMEQRYLEQQQEVLRGRQAQEAAKEEARRQEQRRKEEELRLAKQREAERLDQERIEAAQREEQERRRLEQERSEAARRQEQEQEQERRRQEEERAREAARLEEVQRAREAAQLEEAQRAQQAARLEEAQKRTEIRSLDKAATSRSLMTSGDDEPESETSEEDTADNASSMTKSTVILESTSVSDRKPLELGAGTGRVEQPPAAAVASPPTVQLPAAAMQPSLAPSIMQGESPGRGGHTRTSQSSGADADALLASLGNEESSSTSDDGDEDDGDWV